MRILMSFTVEKNIHYKIHKTSYSIATKRFAEGERHEHENIEGEMVYGNKQSSKYRRWGSYVCLNNMRASFSGRKEQLTFL